jgi:hypothetical protein
MNGTIQKFLRKFTNQSGGYHFPIGDPLAFPGYISAMAAMAACGLPMDKFEPVVTPALLFSNPLMITKSNVTHSQHSVTHAIHEKSTIPVSTAEEQFMQDFINDSMNMKL